MAQPPLLENGGEWTRLATNLSPPPRVATCRTVLKSDRVPLPLTIFVLIGRAEAFSQAEVGFDLRTEGPVSWELSLLRLCVLLVIGAAGIALSSVLYRNFYVPGLAAAVSLNAIMPQSVVPPWSYIAAAVVFW